MTSEKESSGKGERESAPKREPTRNRVREEADETEGPVIADNGDDRRHRPREDAEGGQRTDGGQDTADQQAAKTRRYPISESESPSEVVSLAVLDSQTGDGGTAVEDQRPLYEVVDPDALDSLFETRPGHERSGGRVRFAYEGHGIVVRGGDEVVVQNGNVE